jgi:hypothetical protein
LRGGCRFCCEGCWRGKVPGMAWRSKSSEGKILWLAIIYTLNKKIVLDTARSICYLSPYSRKVSRSNRTQQVSGKCRLVRHPMETTWGLCTDIQSFIQLLISNKSLFQQLGKCFVVIEEPRAAILYKLPLLQRFSNFASRNIDISNFYCD